ncbi:uncharacterized protein [Salvelinus alpinus]|uniref:uncharacterized protein isoform X5 n=1 Tax=Salvelinus alpinus TaxID=8036 RepID=UPI0039FCDED5
MSLLSLVDEAIKLCKVEETKINENILQYREILRSLRPQQEDCKEIELTDDVEKDPDVQLEERREMELLNRLLEKALRVRVGTAPQKDPQNCTGPKKEPVDTTQGKGRLWDKVMALQSKPVAERSHFTERVKATFPREWPTSGSPADTGAQVDRLTQLCTDLSHCYQSERLLLLTGQTFRTSGTEPVTSPARGDAEGGMEGGIRTCQKREYETLLMLEGLEKMVADLRKHAGQLRKEREAWDRWRRPKGEGAGAFCPVRSKGEWGDLSGVTPLPPTLTYTSQAELQEVERLRLRVELLQQEVHLHQALSDTMVMPSAPGPPNPAALRDIYSLLGEGGVMFPTLVLDTEPD